MTSADRTVPGNQLLEIKVSPTAAGIILATVDAGTRTRMLRSMDGGASWSDVAPSHNHGFDSSSPVMVRESWPSLPGTELAGDAGSRDDQSNRPVWTVFAMTDTMDQSLWRHL